jgi:branched-chain amino acid transport system ATP-binding protein
VIAGLLAAAHRHDHARTANRCNQYKAHQLVGKGIAMVPEGRGVFARLTVTENLEMGAYHRRDRDGIARDMKHVFELFPRLEERRNQVAGTLSGGEQQMLAMGRALMSTPQCVAHG